MTDSSQEEITDFEWLEVVVDTIFSWVILMPISVIISGIMLAKIIDFSVEAEHVFKVPIKLLNIEAKGGEVILGFAGFIITLTGIGFFAGQDIYIIVKNDFGVDPGHFNAICMFSSFATVIWTSILLAISSIFSKGDAETSSRHISDKHNELIKFLAMKDRGDNSGK